MHLADLGADVIKIEQPPRGDYYRQVGPPFQGGPSLNHLETNRGKRSLALNLKNPRGLEIARELIEKSQVMLEGMRAGALAKLGLGFEEVKVLNPAIVYCSISGVGATGPYHTLPTHGLAFDSYSGLIPVARREDGTPYIGPHLSLGTVVGPLYGALGVVAGIVRAQQTGQGEYIEVSQAEAGALLQSSGLMRGLNTGWGGQWMWEAPVRYQFYDTKDEKIIMFQAMEQKFWANFCNALGRDDLLARDKGEFIDNAPGDQELRAELVQIFKTKSQAEWVQFFMENDVAGAPVHDLEGVTKDPHFVSRRNYFDYTHPQVGEMKMTATPIRVKGQEFMPGPAPQVGEHSDEILLSVLGLDSAACGTLRETGAIG
jgi:crotonobetainyl-CoA:carnitine CoA-transferase CaiB-like acyl-CoA transferase